jgi:hypothetical protein
MRYSATPIPASGSLVEVVSQANIQFKRIESALMALSLSGLLGPASDGAMLRYDAASASWVTGTTPVKALTAIGTIAFTVRGSFKQNTGIQISGQLDATGNNDKLYAIRTSPVFGAGAFTGVDFIGLKIDDVSGASGVSYAILSGAGIVRFGDTTGTQLGTITSQKLVVDDAVTWNSGGTVFTAWQLNVTNTASSNNSKLVDIQVGGTSRFKIEIGTGTIFIGDFTVPNGQAGVRVNQGTVTSGSESALVVTATYNIAGSPDLVSFNISNTASGAATNFFVCYLGGVGVFSVYRDGQTGVCGGAVTTSALRVGSAASVNANGVEIVPKFLTSASPMYVVRITGTADAGTYTTATVNIVTLETFVKAVNQTITTWVGLKILAPPTATNVRAIWTAGGWWLNDSTSSVILSNAALPTSATDGFTYIPTCAGTPTGTPTTQTGTVPMVFDTTNTKLYCYTGGAWKSVTLA